MAIMEIATWTLSDAYFADHGIINCGIEFLKNATGCRRYGFTSIPSTVILKLSYLCSVHWGISEEDKKRLFLFVGSLHADCIQCLIICLIFLR